MFIRVRPERFPPETVKERHTRRPCSHKVLRRIGAHAYELDIPQDFGISLVFNVKELTLHHAPDDYPATP